MCKHVGIIVDSKEARHNHGIGVTFSNLLGMWDRKQSWVWSTVHYKPL